MEDMIVKHHVPILDEHELKDNKGNVVIRLDKDKLQEIVNTNNTRMSNTGCLLYTSPSPRDGLLSRMPSSA